MRYRTSARVSATGAAPRCGPQLARRSHFEFEPAFGGVEVDHQHAPGPELELGLAHVVEIAADVVLEPRDDMVSAGGDRQAAVDRRGAVPGQPRRRRDGLNYPLSVEIELDRDRSALARTIQWCAHVGRQFCEFLRRTLAAFSFALRRVAYGQPDQRLAGREMMIRRRGRKITDDRHQRHVEQRLREVAQHALHAPPPSRTMSACGVAVLRCGTSLNASEKQSSCVRPWAMNAGCAAATMAAEPQA